MDYKYSGLDNNKLHLEAITTARDLRSCETKLIELIGIINDKHIYIHFGSPNIYDYCEKYLQFKYQKVFDFLKLYKVSKDIPELKEELNKGEVGYSKLRTIIPALEVKKEENNNNDIKLLLEKTKTATRNELEKITRDIAPLASSNLPSPAPKYIGNGKIERVVRLTKEQEVLLDKAITLISNELGENVNFEKFLEIASERIIENKLKKGNKKAQIIVDKETVTTKSVGELKINKDNFNPGVCAEQKQKSIPLNIKNKVIKRDGNKCRVCGKASKLHFHHITPKNDSGTHEDSNLILLCGSCHALLHRGYIKINNNEHNNLIFEYKESDVLTFTDYIYKQKRETYLKTNQKIKSNKKPIGNLTLSF